MAKLTKKTLAKIDEWSEEFDRSVADIKKMVNDEIKKQDGAKNAEKVARILVVSKLTAEKGNKLDAITLQIIGSNRYNDRNDFNINMSIRHAKEILENTDDPFDIDKLADRGKSGYSLGQLKYRNQDKNCCIMIFDQAFEDDVKEEYEHTFDLTFSQDGVNNIVIMVIVDMLKSFPNSGDENPNFGKSIGHQYSRIHLGVYSTDEDDEIHPCIIGAYDKTAKKDLSGTFELNAKVSMMSLDDETEIAVITLNNDTDFDGKTDALLKTGEAIDLFGELLQEKISISAIRNLWDDKPEWKSYAFYNKIPRIYLTVNERVVQQSRRVVEWSGMFPGILADMEDDEDEDESDLTIPFNTYKTNGQPTAPSIIKTIEVLTSDKKYDPDARQRLNEKEPVVLVLAWSTVRTL